MQTGLLAGLYVKNSPIDVIRISLRAKPAQQITNVHKLAAEATEAIGAKGKLPESMVVANEDYVVSGYGQPTDSMVVAISPLAREEGVFLDTVYSANGLAKMIDPMDKDSLKQDQTVAFNDTGGGAALTASGHLSSRRLAA